MTLIIWAAIAYGLLALLARRWPTWARVSTALVAGFVINSVFWHFASPLIVQWSLQ